MSDTGYVDSLHILYMLIFCIFYICSIPVSRTGKL